MFCISVSYKKTPLEIREKFAFTQEEQEALLQRLTEQEYISGVVVLSTCNRSEIYFSGTNEQMEQVIRVFADMKQLNEDDIKQYGFFYGESSAARHLFSVCAGLDSMVIGEDEILHQVKEAYLCAADHGYTDGELNILFQGAFHGAKLAKSKTSLSTTPLSIGTLTANEIEQYLVTRNKENNDKGKGSVLIIGASGKIGSIVAKDLLAKGISVIGTSRNHHDQTMTFSRYQEQMKWIDFKERYQYMEQADVIVSATVSPHYTVTKHAYCEVMSTDRNKLLVDLAVPGDIDKELRKLSGITLLDIDHFKNASKENQDVRLGEVEKAEQILKKCLEDTLKKLYLWKYEGKLNNRNEEWFSKMIYYLKEVLDSEQFSLVLERICLKEMEE